MRGEMEGEMDKGMVFDSRIASMDEDNSLPKSLSSPRASDRLSMNVLPHSLQTSV
jgi:hypothetical protein